MELSTNNNRPTIRWTRDKAEELRRLMQGLEPSDIVIFEGYEILVGYGRYLYEYLDKVLPAKKGDKR